MRHRGPLRAFAQSALVLLLGACASLTPQQAGRLKEAQDIANETTRLYAVPHVSVFLYEDLGPNTAGGYAGRQGWILPRRSALEDWTFMPVLAHELGHATLRHEQQVAMPRDQPPTMAAYRRALQQRELDANARAVEIMVRVLKKSEPEAVMTIASYLAGANTSRGGRAIGIPQNHMHPCDQLQDLTVRFPGEWSREVTCEKATGNLPLLPYYGTDRELGLD